MKASFIDQAKKMDLKPSKTLGSFLKKKTLIILFGFALAACSSPESIKEETESNPSSHAKAQQASLNASPANSTGDSKAMLPIDWQQLMTEEFSSEALLARFETRIANVKDNTQEADELMEEITALLNNAPVNEAMSGKKISIEGFIAPITVSGEEVTEFLLAPYVGACIHVPAPPINQTIFVSLKEGQSVSVHDTYSLMNITGIIEVANKKKTDLGTAGYIINNADVRLSLNQ